MKRFLSMLAVAFTMLFVACTATPSDYFDEISSEIGKVADAQRILENVSNEDTVQEAKSTISKVYHHLQRIDSYRGDDTLRAAALDYAKIFYDIYCSEDGHYLALHKRVLNGDTLTEEENIEHDNLFQSYLNLSTQASVVFSKAEESFMKNYGLIPDLN